MLVSSQRVFVCLWLFVLAWMNINCDCLYCDRVGFKNDLSLCCCRFPRCEGHFHRQETNVTHVRSEFTWWNGCVQRDSTSTGSVSAVPRVAVPCGRDRTPSTPSTVCVVKQQRRTHMWLLSDINATAFTSQVNCTVSFTLIDWKTAQTCTGTCPFVRWVLFLNIPAALKQLLLLNITFPPSAQSRHAAAVEEPIADEGQSSEDNSSDDLQSQSSAGTFGRFIKTRLSWPLNVIGAVCGAPRHLCRSMCSAAQALREHLRNNGQDYAALFEQLSMSLPLLLVLQEVLLQMYSEPAQEGPTFLQPLWLWLQENVGLGLV